MLREDAIKEIKEELKNNNSLLKTWNFLFPEEKLNKIEENIKEDIEEEIIIFLEEEYNFDKIIEVYNELFNKEIVDLELENIIDYYNYNEM